MNLSIRFRVSFITSRINNVFRNKLKIRPCTYSVNRNGLNPLSNERDSYLRLRLLIVWGIKNSRVANGNSGNSNNCANHPTRRQRSTRHFLFVISLLIQRRKGIMCRTLFRRSIPIFVQNICPIRCRLFFFGKDGAFRVFVW